MSYKHILKCIFFICVTLIIFPSINTLASEKSSESIDNFQVSKTANTINIKWEPIPNASFYVIKYNDDIIYTGKEAEFETKNLSEGSMNEYELVALNKKNVIISNNYLKIFTTLSDNEEIGVDQFSSSTTISLDWPDVENIIHYEIYRDGKKIGTTKDSHFNDSGLLPDSKYEYTITGQIPFTSEELSNAKSQLKQAYESEGISTDLITKAINEFEKDAYNHYEISTPAKTLKKNSKEITLKEFEAASQISPLAVVSKTWVKIVTMILNTSEYPGYIPAPTGDYYYGTDNRTTITSQGSTRSSLEAEINWSTLAVTQEKSVGWTNRYKKNSNGTYTFVDRKQASSSDVYLGATKKTSSMVDINFLHSAANPYHLLSPNVKYEFRSEIYYDGTTKIRGYHSLFPSLGIFRSDGSGYRTIYTFNQGTNGPLKIISTKTIDIVKTR